MLIALLVAIFYRGIKVRNILIYDNNRSFVNAKSLTIY